MESNLFTRLKLSVEPVAVYFTDKLPENQEQFLDGKKFCAATSLIASAKGKSTIFSRNTYEGCIGGKMGLGFDNTYDSAQFPIECLLSTGDDALAQLGKSSPFPMGRGERFFASPEIALRWRDACLGFATIPNEYVVFKPFSAVSQEDPPALVVVFANPDQISALVIITNFYRGDMLSVIAPFGAACQSICYAYNEAKKEKPMAIMGFFDTSQRPTLPKELLSFTITFSMYEEMEKSVDESCLSTDIWKKIDKRL